MEQAANQEEIDEMLELNFEEALDPARFLRNELYYTFWRIIVLKKLIRAQSDTQLKSQLMAFVQFCHELRWLFRANLPAILGTIRWPESGCGSSPHFLSVIQALRD